MVDSPGKLLSYYLSKGNVEEISGDVTTSASQWLEQAKSELPGVAVLIDLKQYRMAYKNAYDIIRNAGEAIITKAGYRIASNSAHHEGLFAVANELVGEGSEAFSGYRSAQARGKRTRAQYIDVNRNTEVDLTEARTAYAWAEEAVEVASKFLSRS